MADSQEEMLIPPIIDQFERRWQLLSTATDVAQYRHFIKQINTYPIARLSPSDRIRIRLWVAMAHQKITEFERRKTTA
jgi:hypothetical protein